MRLIPEYIRHLKKIVIINSKEVKRKNFYRKIAVSIYLEVTVLRNLKTIKKKDTFRKHELINNL